VSLCQCLCLSLSVSLNVCVALNLHVSVCVSFTFPLLMLSSHLMLCHPLFLLPPIPPSIRVFSNESTIRMRWPKYWSFSFSIISSKENQKRIKNKNTTTPKLWDTVKTMLRGRFKAYRLTSRNKKKVT